MYMENTAFRKMSALLAASALIVSIIITDIICINIMQGSTMSGGSR